jgi:tetratricopeptide (TPR) repeat protein
MTAATLIHRPCVAEEAERPWAVLLAAARAAVQGHPEAARRSLEALPRAKRSPEVLAALALTHLLAGRHAEGRSLLDEVTKAAPTMAEGQFWLAVASLRLGDQRRAEVALDAAVSLDASRSDFRLARGLARNAVGRPDEAVEDVLAAARLQPNALDPTYHPDERRGLLCLVERALRTFPDRALVDETLLTLLYDAGLLLEARRRAMAATSTAAFDVLGRLAVRDGEYGTALRHLERAAAERPRSAETWFHLARAASLDGAEARAMSALQEAARLDPTDFRVHTALGDLHLKRGDLDRAELAYGYAVSRKLDPFAYAGLGRTRELRGDVEGALRSYRKAVELAPVAVEPVERLARLLEHRDPTDAEAKALRRRLEAVTKLEREVEARVEAIEAAARAHERACSLVATDPVAALAKLEAGKGVPPAALALARAAAFQRAKQDARARQHARGVLGSLSAKRWSRGARPVFSLHRSIGPVDVTRIVPLDFVRLE